MTHGIETFSVVIPFHKDLSQLRACLGALTTFTLRARRPRAELLVAADGAAADPGDVARQFGARVVVVRGPRGPAIARNRAAATATGEVLVFVDSDVVVHPDALSRILSLLEERPEVAAVFGSYDESPHAPGLVSQARNLAHAFVHRGSAGNAVTFWAGLGAVRAEAFRAVGGFDERFARPSVEDIDLGYRLTLAGHRIVLDPSVRGTHLKPWTASGALVSDLRDRGIPWTQLIARYGGLHNTLNLAHRYRVCVILAFALLATACTAVAWPAWWLAPLACLVVLMALDGDYYRFMARCRGWWFALRTVPLRLAHHLANGVSFAVGIGLHVFRRWGVHVPGSLPLDAWTPAHKPLGPRRLATQGSGVAADRTPRTDPQTEPSRLLVRDS